jgi:hypothetical protein
MSSRGTISDKVHDSAWPATQEYLSTKLELELSKALSLSHPRLRHDMRDSLRQRQRWSTSRHHEWLCPRVIPLCNLPFHKTTLAVYAA